MRRNSRNKRFPDEREGVFLPRGYHGNYDDYQQPFSRRRRRLIGSIDDNYRIRKGNVQQALNIRAKEEQLMFKSAWQINGEEQLESHNLRNKIYRRMAGVPKKLAQLNKGKRRLKPGKTEDSKRQSRLANLTQHHVQLRKHLEVLYVVKDNLIEEQHFLDEQDNHSLGIW